MNGGAFLGAGWSPKLDSQENYSVGVFMFSWFGLIYQRELVREFTGVPSLDIDLHRCSIGHPEDLPLNAAH